MQASEMSGPENTTVTLAFQPQLEDHVAADRLYESTTRWPAADRVVAVTLVAVGTGLTIAVGPRWWTLLWFPLALLEWFHLLTIRPFVMKRWFRTNPKFKEPYELAFGESGIRFKTPTIDSTLAWATYYQVLEDERVFLLVYAPRMYTVVPKRAFTVDQERTFRALLLRHIPEA